jgi:hypothetical protein
MRLWFLIQLLLTGVGCCEFTWPAKADLLTSWPPVWRHKVCWQTFTQMLHTMLITPSPFFLRIANLQLERRLRGAGQWTKRDINYRGEWENLTRQFFLVPCKMLMAVVFCVSLIKQQHKFLYASVVGAIFWVENTRAAGGEATTTNALIGEGVGVPLSHWLAGWGLAAERNAIDLFFSCDL